MRAKSKQHSKTIAKNAINTERYFFDANTEKMNFTTKRKSQMTENLKITFR